MMVYETKYMKEESWGRAIVDTTIVQSYPHLCRIMGMLAFFGQDTEQGSA